MLTIEWRVLPIIRASFNMKAMKPWVVVLLFVCVIQACTVVNQPPPQQKTQLQVREFETREFDTNDSRLILKAVLNVLQDDGFVVKNAVPDLGLLTATKEIQLSGSQSRSTNSRNDADTWGDIFEAIFRSGSNNQRNRQQRTETTYNKFKQVEVSVNVTELGKRCRVRANFLAKVLDNLGNPVEVYNVDDPKFYQDFFVKVDKGVFLQKQGF
jgi:hypothetical protein